MVCLQVTGTLFQCAVSLSGPKTAALTLKCGLFEAEGDTMVQLKKGQKVNFADEQQLY